MVQKRKNKGAPKKKILRTDAGYWRVLGDKLGWRLYGWTYRQGATFINKQDQTHHFTAAERDDVLDVNL
jgi:hypothetical protein